MALILHFLKIFHLLKRCWDSLNNPTFAFKAESTEDDSLVFDWLTDFVGQSRKVIETVRQSLGALIFLPYHADAFGVTLLAETSDVSAIIDDVLCKHCFGRFPKIQLSLDLCKIYRLFNIEKNH